jgi:hypothetical protein
MMAQTLARQGIYQTFKKLIISMSGDLDHIECNCSKPYQDTG